MVLSADLHAQGKHSPRVVEGSVMWARCIIAQSILT